MNARSSTGVVHAVDDYHYLTVRLEAVQYAYRITAKNRVSFVRPTCGHVTDTCHKNYYPWELTSAPITCKKCLAELARKDNEQPEVTFTDGSAKGNMHNLKKALEKIGLTLKRVGSGPHCEIAKIVKLRM